jgi:homoserine acetyltransferase
MVDAQYRLVTQGLGLHHLRLVLGNSMGGMHAWIWGIKYPDVMDALVPMASQPTEMSSRNWMIRRLIIDSIRNDPDWNNGNYTAQPNSVRVASVFYGIATARHAGTPEDGSYARSGRQATRWALDCTVPTRCQRRSLKVGRFTGLQSLTRIGTHPGCRPCNQFGR